MNQWVKSPEFYNTDWTNIRRHRHGAITINHSGQVEIQFRWWAKRVSLLGARMWGSWQHARLLSFACRLFYSEPPNSRYLALTYVVSGRGCPLAWFRLALITLDQMALIKQSDAILCQVTNDRISTRLLHRWGWEHQPMSRSKAVWIKRFYGDYSRVHPLPSSGSIQFAQQAPHGLPSCIDIPSTEQVHVVQ
ncbi:MAG TPA: hypothetical protein PKD54_04615 [Pirellulaceae bacterium]|nr:hypothetical protein [Pirellulaceae bacterium]